MSEPIFTAGGGAAAPAATEPAPDTRSNRKALLAVGGVVGAVVVGAGAFFMLTQGAPQDDLAQGAKTPGVSAPKPQASASAKPGGTKVVKVATVTSRDPFVALFPDPKPASDSTSGGGTVTTPTDGTAPSGGTSQPNRATDARAPAAWAPTNAGTSSGRMPANVSVNARAIVTAGFANDVDDVNQ